MENFIEYLEKLNPYESEGFDCDRLRTLKELLIAFPEKAKLAFDTMEFAGKIWGGELELAFKKRPLGSVSQFFYCEYNSIEHFVEMQVVGIKSDIESTDKYITTLKKEKDRIFWKNMNKERENEIVELKTKLNNINKLSL